MPNDKIVNVYLPNLMASRISGEHITSKTLVLAKLKKSKINDLNLVVFRQIKNHCCQQECSTYCGGLEDPYSMAKV
jgi:hypothetical protein